MFKAILAVMVIAIHSHLGGIYLYPWLRLAVPSFFLMSSYFFFSKYRRGGVKSFSTRLFGLYAAWFVVLLPITLYMKRYRWFCGLHGAVVFLRDLLFGSTFAASWFFSALLLGVLVVYLARKILPSVCVVILSLIPFALVCFSSSWAFAVKDCGLLASVENDISVVMTPQFSVLASVFWVAVGALLAGKPVTCSKRTIAFALFAGCVILLLEWLYVYVRTGDFAGDSFFALPFVVIPLFLLVKASDMKIASAKNLRMFSVVAFPLHYSVIYCIHCILKRTTIVDGFGVIRFFSAIAASIVVVMLIRKAERAGIYVVRWLH